MNTNKNVPTGIAGLSVPKLIKLGYCQEYTDNATGKTYVVVPSTLSLQTAYRIARHNLKLANADIELVAKKGAWWWVKPSENFKFLYAKNPGHASSVYVFARKPYGQWKAVKKARADKKAN